MMRWLRQNAQTVTLVCVSISVILGGVLAYIFYQAP